MSHSPWSSPSGAGRPAFGLRAWDQIIAGAVALAAVGAVYWLLALTTPRHHAIVLSSTSHELLASRAEVRSANDRGADSTHFNPVTRSENDSSDEVSQESDTRDEFTSGVTPRWAESSTAFDSSETDAFELTLESAH